MKRSPALWVFVQIFCSAERLIVVPELTTPVVAALPGPGVTVLPLAVLVGAGVVLVGAGVVFVGVAGAFEAGALLPPAATSVPVGGVVSRFARSRSRFSAESAASESALSPPPPQAPSTSAHDSASGVPIFRIYFLIVVSLRCGIASRAEQGSS